MSIPNAEDILESEQDTVALGVLLLINVDRAVDHRNDAVAELDNEIMSLPFMMRTLQHTFS